MRSAGPGQRGPEQRGPEQRGPEQRGPEQRRPETPATARLSACIVAMNEEDRLGDCLASIQFCDEILVIDSHSTDRTRDVATEGGARVIERDWPGMVEQKNFAIDAAAHDWVLCLDADERLSPELARELADLKERGFPGYSGWSFPRLSNYLGTWIRAGTWYPDRQLRLFDRRRGRWTGADPHGHVELDATSSQARLAPDMLHYPYRSFTEHLQSIDRYTTIMAEGMHARGRRASVIDITLRPAGRFFRFYFLGRGFLLGWKGLLLAYLAAHYGRLKYAKLMVLQRK